MIQNLVKLCLVCLLLGGVFFLSGCRTTADREITRAERAIDEALDYNADAYATDDYNAAEELLREAVDLQDDGRIEEARHSAIKSKLRAEEALKKAKEVHRIHDYEAEQTFGN